MGVSARWRREVQHELHHSTLLKVGGYASRLIALWRAGAEALVAGLPPQHVAAAYTFGKML
jgi:hypothetical protein